MRSLILSACTIMSLIVEETHEQDILNIHSELLEEKEFRCFRAKVEESKKVSSHQELNLGHLAATLSQQHSAWVLS